MCSIRHASRGNADSESLARHKQRSPMHAVSNTALEHPRHGDSAPQHDKHTNCERKVQNANGIFTTGHTRWCRPPIFSCVAPGRNTVGWPLSPHAHTLKLSAPNTSSFLIIYISYQSHSSLTCASYLKTNARGWAPLTHCIACSE